MNVGGGVETVVARGDWIKLLLEGGDFGLVEASSGATELSLPAARLCDEAIARIIPELAADTAVGEEIYLLLPTSCPRGSTC